MHAVVIGAGAAGLGTALALARDGHEVTIVERDATPLPRDADAAFEWDRTGAPQVRHSHAFLARLRNLLRDRWPDVLERLLAAGATEIDFCAAPPAELGALEPEPGDEDLVAIACRRTTYEWVLRQIVLEEAGTTLIDGASVAQLLVAGHDPDGRPIVSGVELDGPDGPRRVEADGTELGDGYGAFLEVGRPIWENLKETSRLYAAYRADYEKFDAKAISPGQAAALGYIGDPADGRFLGAELVEPRYHPHGVQLTYESQINPQLFHFLSAGLYFDFADEEWDYNFSAGLEYAITDTIDLILEGGYYSDGTGAASNEDSAVYSGSIGIRAYY